MPKITKNTTLAGVLKQCKNAEKILMKYNVPCITCPFAKFEMENLKIGQVCEMYKINLSKLLKDLNKDEGNSGNQKSKS